MRRRAGGAKAPPGVTERTIMSRDGMITPLKNPPSDMVTISSTVPRSIRPTRTAVAAMTTSPIVATSPLSRITTPLPARSVPSVCAVKASAGT